MDSLCFVSVLAARCKAGAGQAPASTAPGDLPHADLGTEAACLQQRDGDAEVTFLLVFNRVITAGHSAPRYRVQSTVRAKATETVFLSRILAASEGDLVTVASSAPKKGGEGITGFCGRVSTGGSWGAARGSGRGLCLLVLDIGIFLERLHLHRCRAALRGAGLSCSPSKTRGPESTSHVRVAEAVPRAAVVQARAPTPCGGRCSPSSNDGCTG